MHDAPDKSIFKRLLAQYVDQQGILLLQHIVLAKCALGLLSGASCMPVLHE